MEKQKDGNTLRVEQEREDVRSVGTKIIVKRDCEAVDARYSNRLGGRLEKEEEQRVCQDEWTLAVEEDREIEGGVTKRIRHRVGGEIYSEWERRQTANHGLQERKQLRKAVRVHVRVGSVMDRGRWKRVVEIREKESS